MADIFERPNKKSEETRKQEEEKDSLLKNKVIRYPNQVWSTDITYIKLPTGNVYLMAIIDWFSRKVLSWRVFNTMDGCSTQICSGKQSKNTAVLQSSIQTREVSLHLMCSLKFLSITTSRSAWTEKTGLWTTSELSVFGEASSTRTSILNATKQ